MNYYKGLEKIGKTGDFDKIPTELLHDYINDFTLEFNSRSLVKKLNIAIVINSCVHQYVWDNPNNDDCMKRTCKSCGHKDA